MANLKIVAEAKRALKAAGYPTLNNQCQKWARMVVQRVIGHKFDAWLQKATAKKAAISLADKGIAFPKSELAKHGGLQPGDLLYKTVGSGGNGHVGIYEDAQHVYENSSVHFIRSGQKDARGVRTLAQFGDFQYVARFPDTEEDVTAKPTETAKPKEPVICVLDGKPHPCLIDENRRPYIQVASLVDSQGRVIAATTNKLDQNPPRFYVNTELKG